MRPLLAKDQPGKCLIEYSRRAQLVVVGRRGRGGFNGMLLGNTCREVIHAAQCPVMIANSGR
ncbi:Universal stress protein [Rhodococcus sp. AD45]|nr:Universal stress protein [Rhodococcus sp. AD45]